MIIGSVIGLNNSNNNNPGTYYGECSTAGDVVIKDLTIPNFQLIDNRRVAIKFQNTNTANNPMLNINNTGNKPIYYKNTAISIDTLKANIIYDFIYNDNKFQLIDNHDNIILFPFYDSHPSAPINGQVYFNTAENKLYIYYNTWIALN